MSLARTLWDPLHVRVLRLLRDEGPLSRAELGDRLELPRRGCSPSSTGWSPAATSPRRGRPRRAAGAARRWSS